VNAIHPQGAAWEFEFVSEQNGVTDITGCVGVVALDADLGMYFS
jgi:hypothetical protein